MVELTEAWRAMRNMELPAILTTILWNKLIGKPTSDCQRTRKRDADLLQIHELKSQTMWILIRRHLNLHSWFSKTMVKGGPFGVVFFWLSSEPRLCKETILTGLLNTTRSAEDHLHHLVQRISPQMFPITTADSAMIGCKLLHYIASPYTSDKYSGG